MLNKYLLFILTFLVINHLSSQTTTWDGTSWSNFEPAGLSTAVIDGPLAMSDMSSNYLWCTNLVINATITMDVDNSYIKVFSSLSGGDIKPSIPTPIVSTHIGTYIEVSLSKWPMELKGSLSIPDGMTFKVNKANPGPQSFITNDFLILETGANMYPVSLAKDDLQYISGNVTVKQTGSGLYYKFNAWSSPIENANITSVFPGVGAVDIWAFSDGGIDETAYTNASGNMTEGRGYYVVGNASSTRIFNGNINSGDISINTSSEGWVLLGNPYPGLLYLGFFNTTNKAILKDTYYFFVDDNSAGAGYTGDDYATFNALTNTGVAANGSTTPTGFVRSCQGFFNDADIAGSINYSASHIAAKKMQSFYRQSSTYGRVWLNVFDADSNFSEMAIVFGDSFLVGLDDGDSKKKLMSGSMSIHTYLNNTPYVMQAYPFPGTSQVIDLGVMTYDSSVYDISLKHHENLPAGAKLFLEDIDSNIMHDLSTGPYSVLLPKDSITGRFFLHVQPLTTDFDADLIEKTDLISCYYNSNTIFINGTKNIGEVKSISVYDISGRLQYFENINSSSHKYIIPYNIKGINIVQVRTKTGIIYKRIYI